MEKIKVVIVEDELHNSRMLEAMVNDLRPSWEVVAILESVKDSVSWLNSNESPSLLLMDIQLTDGICFSIFDKVILDSSTKVIFTTAYDQYAIQAFRVNSIDYILKPINESDLERAFDKFDGSNIEKREKSLPYKEILDSIVTGEKSYRKRFLLSGVNGFVKINTDDIALFYSKNRVNTVVTFDGKEHAVNYTLEQIEKELDPEIFFRINRQAIANVDSIKRVDLSDGGKLKVIAAPKENLSLTVSRLKASEFKEWLGH